MTSQSFPDISLWWRERPFLNPNIHSMAAPPQNRMSVKICNFQVIVHVFFILNSYNSLKILVPYFLLCGCTEHQQIRLHCGIISTVLFVDSVIELCHSSEHCAQQNASHTNKGSHKTPPEYLTVSIVRRHENPCSRSLFEPTLRDHLHSSNLPNTLCSFCSLFQCLLQAEMHNISVMGKERHNVSPPATA